MLGMRMLVILVNLITICQAGSELKDQRIYFEINGVKWYFSVPHIKGHTFVVLSTDSVYAMTYTRDTDGIMYLSDGQHQMCLGTYFAKLALRDRTGRCNDIQKNHDSLTLQYAGSTHFVCYSAGSIKLQTNSCNNVRYESSPYQYPAVQPASSSTVVTLPPSSSTNVIKKVVVSSTSAQILLPTTSVTNTNNNNLATTSIPESTPTTTITNTARQQQISTTKSSTVKPRTTTATMQQIIQPLSLSFRLETTANQLRLTELTYALPSMITTAEILLTASETMAVISPTLSSSVIQLQSSAQAVPNNETYFSSFGPWNQNVCPEKCKRSKTTTNRQCISTLIQAEATHEEECYSFQEKEMECLDLTNCTGTGKYLAQPGQSCGVFCKSREMSCSTILETGNKPTIFDDVILHYNLTDENSKWQHDYGPYCNVSGECGEYVNVPESLDCNVKPPLNIRRLCSCEDYEDIGYGGWSSWSDCSVTCEGLKYRTRECFDYCSGNDTEVKECGTMKCPVHGGFSEWSHWSNCSKPCEGGHQNKTRVCNNPKPHNGGMLCVGDTLRTQKCNVNNCPIDAVWSEWTIWSGCDKPCNNGSFVRKRYCSKALFGGKISCNDVDEDVYKKEDIERLPCNTHACPNTFANFQMTVEMDYDQNYSNSSSKEFIELEKILFNQFNSMMTGVFNRTIIKSLILHSARQGSVIVNSSIQFESFDSSQFITIQDGLEVDHTAGKLSISDIGDFTVGPSIATSPHGIQAISDSSTTLYITWVKPNNNTGNWNITGYIVFYRESTSPHYETQATNETQTNVTGLIPNSLYIIRVLASSDNGNGIASSALQIRTQKQLPDLAVTSIIATSYDPHSIHINWKGIDALSMNGEPLGYKIYTYKHGKLVLVNSTEFLVDHILITGLSANTMFTFEVCPFNDFGNGPCDQTQETTLNQVPTGIPLNLTTALNRTHNKLTISWLPPEQHQINGDLKSFKIKWSHSKVDNVIHEIEVHAAFRDYTLTQLSPNTVYTIEVLVMNEYGDGPPATINDKTCNCPEVVTSSYYLLQPYTSQTPDGSRSTGIFLDILSDMIPKICGICQRPNGVYNTIIEAEKNGRNMFAQKQSELGAIQEIDEYTDLTFPVIGSKFLDVFMKYPFVAILEHPGIVLLVHDKPLNEIVLAKVLAILNVAPLFLVNLLIMFVAGIAVWMLEGRMYGNGNFSTKLLRGLQEGWYWAFITQGTHGYGDFTPIHFTSRLVAIIYILISLIVSSLVIGSTVTAITTVEEASRVKIYGTKIGAINGSFENRVGLLRNGKMNTDKAYQTIVELRDALLSRDVEGVLIDAYMAGHSTSLFNHPQIRASQVLYYPRAYGVVLSGQLANVAHEARDYVLANQQMILNMVEGKTIKMKAKEREKPKQLFDNKSQIYQRAVITLSCITVIVALMGYLLYWCCRKRKLKWSKVKDFEISVEEKEYAEVEEMVKIFTNHFKQTVTNISTKHDKRLVERYIASLGKEFPKHFQRLGLPAYIIRNTCIKSNIPKVPTETFELAKRGGTTLIEVTMVDTPYND